MSDLVTGTGAIADGSRRGGNGENRSGEPRAVSLTFDVKRGEETQRISDRFTLVTNPTDQSRLFTTDPQFLTALLAQGPLAFDDLRNQAKAASVRIITASESQGTQPPIKLDNLYTFGMDGDDITYTSEEILKQEPFEDAPGTTLPEVEGEDKRVEYNVAVEGQMWFDNYPAYTSKSQVQEAYRRLGIIKNSDNSFRLPSPSTLKERIEAARRDDIASNVYYPDIELFKIGEIDAFNFVRAFAKGNYPVGAGTFYYYLHDLAQEHLQTVFSYGESLRDIMSEYAKVFTPDDSRSSDPAAVEAYGEASMLLDTLTMNLGSMQFATIDERELAHPDWTTHQDLEEDFDTIVSTLKSSGTIGQLGMVQDMIKQGVVAGADQITGRALANWLITSTRDRWQQEKRAAS